MTVVEEILNKKIATLDGKVQELEAQIVALKDDLIDALSERNMLKYKLDETAEKYQAAQGLLCEFRMRVDNMFGPEARAELGDEDDPDRK